MDGNKKYDEKDYVQPPKENNVSEVFSKFKGIYKNLHPNFIKRKLIHLVIVAPMAFWIYDAIFYMSFESSAIRKLVCWLLTIVACVFYPYALYWYKGSFICALLNNILHIGSFWAVILKVILTILGGIVIAGVLSPVMGISTWYKYKTTDILLGEEKDFE